MKEWGMEEVGKDVMPEGKEIEVNIGKIMPKEQEIKENSGEIMPEEREPERGSDKTAQSKKQKRAVNGRTGFGTVGNFKTSCV